MLVDSFTLGQTLTEGIVKSIMKASSFGKIEASHRICCPGCLNTQKPNSRCDLKSLARGRVGRRHRALPRLRFGSRNGNSGYTTLSARIDGRTKLMENLPPELLLSIFLRVDKIGLLALHTTYPRFSCIIDNDKELSQTMETATSWEKSLSIKTLLRLEAFRAPPSERQRRLEAIRRLLQD